MLTINGKEYVPLKVAAMRKYTTYNALQLWLYRHKEVPRRQIGNVILVCLDDLKDYRRISGR